MLRSPDFTQPFVVQIDASGTSLGAVLTRILAREDHPIVSISRKLQPAEQKYFTIEREMLAIKWALEALQFYLINNPFTLLMDHAPLQWLHRVKDSNPRVPHWYLSLLPFLFQSGTTGGVTMVTPTTYPVFLISTTACQGEGMRWPSPDHAAYCPNGATGGCRPTTPNRHQEAQSARP